MVLELDNLSEDEQRELYAQLAYRLKTAGGRARPFSVEEYAFWRDVGEIVKGSDRRPLNDFTEQFGRGKYIACIKHVNTLLDEALPLACRQAIKVAVKMRMLRCLADYLRSRNIPVTAKTLLSNIDTLEHAINQQFPGYIAVKLLHKIVPIASSR